jgi:hypothetical protein
MQADEASRCRLLGPKRTNWAGLIMSLDRGRPEVVSGASKSRPLSRRLTELGAAARIVNTAALLVPLETGDNPPNVAANDRSYLRVDGDGRQRY